MLRPRRRIALGALLLTIALVGLAFAAGRWRLLETQRHVVVHISNVDGIEQVFINCHLAARVESGEPSESVDLGWLKSDDRIFLSTTSTDRSPAWGFSGTSNGEPLFKESYGSTELPQFVTVADAVVFAKAILASGVELGTIGCQSPGNAVVERRSRAHRNWVGYGYALSPDDKKVPVVTDSESSYRRSNELYDWVDAIGRWSLVVLAALGIAAAASIGPIRRLAWSHRKLAGGALGFLAAIASLFLGVLGVAALITTLTLGGTLVLIGVAALLAVPAWWRRLEGAAGAGGTQG